MKRRRNGLAYKGTSDYNKYRTYNPASKQLKA